MPVIDADFTQQFLMPPCLEDWVPSNHPARFIRDFVDQIDLVELGFQIEADRRGPGGNRYAASLMVRAVLYGWFNKVRSTRELERMCLENHGMMWLVGLHAPDHNAFWRFQDRNREAVGKLLKESARVAAGLGMVSMVFHAVDGTRIAPASSRYSALHRQDLEALMKQVENSIAGFQEEMSAQPESGESFVLSPELADAKVRREKISEQLAMLDAAGKDRMLPREPECPMIGKGASIGWNFNAQAVVDSGHGIVVAAETTTQEKDSGLLVPMIELARLNTGAVAQQTAGDGGYSSQEEFSRAAEKGLEVTVPAAPRGDLHNPFHSHHFASHPELDVLVCPKTGQHLPYSTTLPASKDKFERRVYRCPVFRTCPFATECSKGYSRRIEVTTHRPAVLEQVKKHADGRMSAAMRKRFGLAEPIFGYIKSALQFRRFTVRGLRKVKAQWNMICTTVNLRKIHRFLTGGADPKSFLKPQLHPMVVAR